MFDWISANAAALAMALLLDALLGEPDWLYRRIRHPVVAIGALITSLDKQLNKTTGSDQNRRLLGVIAVVILIVVVGGLVSLVWSFSNALHGGAGFFVSVVIGFSLLAQRSMYKHIEAVRVPLGSGDLLCARQALSMIVGRDTTRLDESGITRAALESLAENHSDGVIAPAFWMLIGGPVGVAVYKAINTADSMVGYKSERYLHFGWAAARIDDLVNWLPARLSPILISLGVLAARLLRYPASLSWPSMQRVLKDAPTHASPNAGWPEAAYASVLGVALGGPRVYPTHTVDALFINATGRRDLSADDLKAGLLLFHATCGVTVLIVFLIALAAF
ncbi:MAG: adenosylcobinamide-phosphate synthase CbiB [Pseudomonadota bacterium]